MASAENQRTAPRGDGMDEEGQAAHLPDDVLAAVLRRVPPRWLAASRCVCRAWRDAVDGRGLLRADLLPLTLAGIFVHFNEHKYPEFLARPPSSAAGSRAVRGDLSFLPSASPHCSYFWEEGCVDWRDYNIQDHCNGLLLLQSNCVVNPATRRWNILPTCPAEDGIGHVMHRSTHLVYDPMVSPHYEVFKIPTLYRYYDDKVDPLMEQSEWPPSLCKMYVFSSKSGCWEERCFSREGDAAGTVSQLRVGYWPFSAVYFRGALYVHCNHNFLMRISLSNNTYSVIKPPMDLTVEGHPDINIARSKKGVYIVASDMYWPGNKYLLRVWILNESCGQVEWMLKHNIDLKHVLAGHHFCGRDQWILEDINYKLFRSSDCQEDSKKATTKENTEWNSDEDVEEEDMIDHSGYLEDKNVVVEKKLVWNSNNDNALNYGGMSEDCYSDEEHYDDSRDEDLRILGFHPYKEIIFLSASERICLAYHLNGSKIEELGNIYPKEYIYFKELVNEQEKIKSFPYTPCWMEEFPGSN